MLSIAAAAAIALVIGGAGGRILRGSNGAGGAPPAEFALSHRAAIAHAVYAPEVRHPVEVGANEEAHLVAWLSKRSGTPIKAPKLDYIGFRLVGGRLLAADQGPAAQFMYEDERGRRITLYVQSDMPAGRETAFRFATERGIGVFYWIDGPAGFAIAGDLDRDDLLKAAKLAHTQVNP